MDFHRVRREVERILARTEDRDHPAGPRCLKLVTGLALVVEIKLTMSAPIPAILSAPVAWSSTMTATAYAALTKAREARTTVLPVHVSTTNADSPLLRSSWPTPVHRRLSPAAGRRHRATEYVPEKRRRRPGRCAAARLTRRWGAWIRATHRIVVASTR
jgi:hypothetical protein